jgi:hypothetical protein
MATCYTVVYDVFFQKRFVEPNRDWLLTAGQVRLPASAGRKLTSVSQVRHCMSMISATKPLSLILLVSISCGAQSLVDAANQERARQAKVKSTRVFTDQNAHTIRLCGARFGTKVFDAGCPGSPACCASGSGAFARRE